MQPHVLSEKVALRKKNAMPIDFEAQPTGAGFSGIWENQHRKYYTCHLTNLTDTVMK